MGTGSSPLFREWLRPGGTGAIIGMGSRGEGPGSWGE